MYGLRLCITGGSTRQTHLIHPITGASIYRMLLFQINGENVMNATHEKTVRLIQETKDVLQMKIITVKTPTTEGVHMHMDGTRTLPMKKKG